MYFPFGKKGKKMTGRFAEIASKERLCMNSGSSSIPVTGIISMTGSKREKTGNRLKAVGF
jgi:hypothetical protein